MPDDVARATLRWHEALSEEAEEAAGSYSATRQRISDALEGAVHEGFSLDQLLELAEKEKAAAYE